MTSLEIQSNFEGSPIKMVALAMNKPAFVRFLLTDFNLLAIFYKCIMLPMYRIV